MYSGNLFDNPMVNCAREQMSEEQINQYEELGKQIFSIDFVNTGNNSDKTDNNFPPQVQEGVLFVESSIRSGQHISTLEDNEKELLKNVFGEKWYERYGFTEKELTEIL